MMGWGAYIDDYLYDNVTVKNHARAGWSSKTFVDGTKTDNNIKNIQNYYWTNIKDTIKPGDYVFFALEINDSSASNPDGTTEEEYRANLLAMLEDVEAQGATAVYLTNTIQAGTAGTAQDWAVTMNHTWERRGEVCRQFAEDNGCVSLPLSKRQQKLYNDTRDAYLAENPNATEIEACDYVRQKYNLYFPALTNPKSEGGWELSAEQIAAHRSSTIRDGVTNDGTHFNMNGANAVAKLIATMLAESSSPLGCYVDLSTIK